jgi:hypothetical protein
MKKEVVKTEVKKPAKLDQFPKGPNLGLFFDLKRNKVTKYVLAVMAVVIAISGISFGLSNSKIEHAKATTIALVKSVTITNVRMFGLDFKIDFTTTNYTNQQGGFHTHFYFNNEASTVVNKMYTGESPYTFPIANALQGATEICAIVGNEDHSVIPDSGNCFTLLPRTGGPLPLPAGISNLVVSQVEGGTQIALITQAAVAINLEYGLLSDTFPLAVTEVQPNTSHSIVLSQLLPCTTYFFRITVPLSGGGLVTVPTQQFTTPGCAGTINTDSIYSDEVISNVRKLIEQLDTNADGIKLDIPAGAFPENRVLQIKKLSAALNSTGNGVADSPVLPGQLKPIGKHVYEIKDFIGTSPAPSTNFNQPISFTIDYSPSDVAGLNPNSLTVKSWDGGSTPWLDHTCVADLPNHAITCSTTHFTTFVLAGNPVTITCTQVNPCALFDTSISFNPTQALAKRYGGSGSSTASDLILTLSGDIRLDNTTTCTFRYKFKSDTAWRNLASNIAYNTTSGCSATLLKVDQLFWNVDFEITANMGTTDYFLAYSNYDFKAGSIGVTSIGGSGL